MIVVMQWGVLGDPERQAIPWYVPLPAPLTVHYAFSAAEITKLILRQYLVLSMSAIVDV